MKIVLSTDNAHKLREFKEILAGSGIELISKKEAGCFIDVEENGTTFEENAFIKAEAVCRATGLPAIADDSGLCVDALGGEPGIYSARYTGRHEDSDVDRYRYLLKKMEGITDRRARFVSAICCVLPGGDAVRALGTCEGEIMEGPEGENGFGYDPIFRPLGYERGMGLLTAEEKNAISHRGNALKAFLAEWEKYNAQQ